MEQYWYTAAVLIRKGGLTGIGDHKEYSLHTWLDGLNSFLNGTVPIMDCTYSFPSRVFGS